MGSEDMIRQLAGGGFGGGGFGGFGGASGGGPHISAPMGQMQQAMQMYNQAAQQSSQCYMRNTRGECANPDSRLSGEYGLMSWGEYDAIKASGRDPYQVAQERNGQEQQRNKYGRIGYQQRMR